MKYLKPYREQSNLCNESITNYLKPKSEEDILKSMQKLDPKNLLLKSAKYGILKGVKLAIERGVDVNVENSDSIIFASSNGYFDIVKYLVQNGANIHFNYEYPLACACGSGNLDIVKYFVENGADIHSNYDYSLVWASSKRHLNVVKYLVEKGADIHTGNDSPLREAGKNGDIDMVKYLLKMGANVEKYISDLSRDVNNHNEADKYVLDFSKHNGTQIYTMKHLNPYNEAAIDFLKPKSKEDIVDSIKDLPDNEKFKKACKYHLTWLVEKMVTSGFDPSFDDNLCLINCGVLKYQDIVDILMKNDKVIHQLYKTQLDNVKKDNDDYEYEYGEDEDGEEAPDEQPNNTSEPYVDWYFQDAWEEDEEDYEE